MLAKPLAVTSAHRYYITYTFWLCVYLWVNCRVDCRATIARSAIVARTIESSICGGDAACCQITLNPCCTAHGGRQSLYFTTGRPPPRNCPCAWGDHSGPPSNTWFVGLTRVYNRNGIWIGSADFAGLTIVTDRQTDKQTTLLCL